MLELAVRCNNGRIEQARFLAKGCVPLIACASIVTEWLEGRTIQECTSLDLAQMQSMIGPLPPTSQHAPKLLIEALRLIRTQL